MVRRGADCATADVGGDGEGDPNVRLPTAGLFVWLKCLSAHCFLETNEIDQIYAISSVNMMRKDIQYRLRSNFGTINTKNQRAPSAARRALFVRRARARRRRRRGPFVRRCGPFVRRRGLYVRRRDPFVRCHKYARQRARIHSRYRLPFFIILTIFLSSSNEPKSMGDVCKIEPPQPRRARFAMRILLQQMNAIAFENEKKNLNYHCRLQLLIQCVCSLTIFL